MSVERCKWHRPDEHGQYQCARFENPAAKQAVNVFLNGAQITIRMETEGQETAHMAFPINYCPVCGERVRLEAGA